ncbi:uncharacterized protein YALI1_E06641g [Yarrowia lipolytica]|uniref:Uncharacterized protein n=1 Tax=Yarrowia lipolytica TaxID=4952 RepID=A0A1D8NH93_YARLL|nr:hypothetical protein YALI1_E06641g [Yarrowia lipolytica]
MKCKQRTINELKYTLKMKNNSHLSSPHQLTVTFSKCRLFNYAGARDKIPNKIEGERSCATIWSCSESRINVPEMIQVPCGNASPSPGSPATPPPPLGTSQKGRILCFLHNESDKYKYSFLCEMNNLHFL